MLLHRNNKSSAISQTDDIHTFCDLGYLKLIVAVCAKRGKIMALNTKGVQLVPRSVTLSKRGGNNAIVYK